MKEIPIVRYLIPMDFSRWLVLGHVFAALSLCLFIGCDGERETLHELDHENPPHWPSNMSDAADKIQYRVAALLSDSSEAVVRKELEELISWTPEIAADTDLTESDWIPIYELSETLRKHLAAGDVSIGDFAQDFDRLQQLLRTSHNELIEEHQESFREQLVQPPSTVEAE